MVVQRLFGAAACCSLLLIAAISARPADQPTDLNSLSDTDLKTLMVRMERIGCYGNCPAYTVTIHGDGRVEYDGKSHVKENGAQRTTGVLPRFCREHVRYALVVDEKSRYHSKPTLLCPALIRVPPVSFDGCQ